MAVEDTVKQELIELLNTKLPPRDVAYDYFFLEDMPLTSVGKENEAEIKNQILKKILK